MRTQLQNEIPAIQTHANNLNDEHAAEVNKHIFTESQEVSFSYLY
jgi:hypothetical protein